MMKVLWLVCLYVLGLAAGSLLEQSGGSFGQRLTKRDRDEAKHETGGHRSKRTAMDPEQTSLTETIQRQIEEGLKIINNSLQRQIQDSLKVMTNGLQRQIEDSLKTLKNDVQRLTEFSVYIQSKYEEVDGKVKSLADDRRTCNDRLAMKITSEPKLSTLVTAELRGDLNSLNNTVSDLKISKRGRLYRQQSNPKVRRLNAKLDRQVDKVKKLEEKLYNHSGKALMIKTRLNRQDAIIESVESSNNDTLLRQLDVESGVEALERDLKRLRCSMKPGIGSATGDWCYNRLLIAGFISSDPTLYQLDLETYQLTEFPHLNDTRIRSLTFDLRRNNILYGQYVRVGVYASPLEGGSVVTVRDDFSTNGMAIDVQRDLLFVATYEPIRTISRMTPEGKDFAIIVNMDHGYGIALDTKRQMVYVAGYYYLLSVSYSGGDVHKLARASEFVWGFWDVTVDMERDVLYYAYVNTIKTRPLSGGDIEDVGEVNGTIMNLIYHNNWMGNHKLYTSPNERNNHIHILLDNGRLIESIRVMEHSVMCLIP